MPRSDIVTDYLDTLARELRFDLALSRRVRREIEDHLLEALAEAADSDLCERERRAVARLGDPREIARQYASSSLFAQTRRIASIMALALIGVFAAMKGRGVWYGLVQWQLSDHWKSIGAVVFSIDLYAFRIALALGVIGCAYLVSRRAPPVVDAAYARQVKRCILLGTAAAAAIIASVMTDALLTGFHLVGPQLPASALVPASSMTAEVALASVLVLCLCSAVRRVTAVSALLSD